MPRQARVVAVDVPHHITHRGNNRQDVFVSDEDRRRYQQLLSLHPRACRVDLLGWCWMTNHVHMIAAPRGLALALDPNGPLRVCAAVQSDAPARRSSMAKSFLFMRFGPRTTRRGAIVCRPESGTRGDQGRGNGMALVERTRPCRRMR